MCYGCDRANNKPLPKNLPNQNQIREWDRHHREECQERSCTLLHRYAAFADWYIVIEQGYRERIERELNGQAGL